MSKTCAKCEIEKDEDDFYKRPESSDGRRTDCIECFKARVTKRYHATPGIQKKRRLRYKPADKRTGDLRRKYGLTPEAFGALLAHQGGVCAVCGTNRPDGRGKCFYVDHDHATGRIRGALCSSCNIMLGFIESFVTRAGIDMHDVGQRIEAYLRR